MKKIITIIFLAITSLVVAQTDSINTYVFAVYFDSLKLDDTSYCNHNDFGDLNKIVVRDLGCPVSVGWKYCKDGLGLYLYDPDREYGKLVKLKTNVNNYIVLKIIGNEFKFIIFEHNDRIKLDINLIWKVFSDRGDDPYELFHILYE